MNIKILVSCFVLFSSCGHIKSLDVSSVQTINKQPTLVTKNNDIVTKERSKPEELKFKAPPVKYLKNEYPQIKISKPKLKKMPLLIPKIIISPASQLQACKNKRVEKAIAPKKSDIKEPGPHAETREENDSEFLSLPKISTSINPNDYQHEDSGALGDQLNRVEKKVKNQTDQEDSVDSKVHNSKNAKTFYEESDYIISKPIKIIPARIASNPDVHSFQNITVLPVLNERVDEPKDLRSEVVLTNKLTEIATNKSKNMTKLEEVSNINYKSNRSMSLDPKKNSSYISENPILKTDSNKNNIKFEEAHKLSSYRSGFDVSVDPVTQNNVEPIPKVASNEKIIPTQKLYTDIKLSDQYQEQIKQARSRTMEEDSAEKDATDDVIIKKEEIKEVIERYNPYNYLFPSKTYPHRSPYSRNYNSHNYPKTHSGYLPKNYEVNGNIPAQRRYDKNIYPIQFYSNLRARNPQDMYKTNVAAPGPENGNNYPYFLFDNAYSNPSLNYKPDNSYTPSPFKYPFEYEYPHNRAIETNTIQPPYSFYSNLPKIPRYNFRYNNNDEPSSYSNYDPTSGYKYKEVVNPGQYLDKIWRTWRKTEVHKKVPKNRAKQTESNHYDIEKKFNKRPLSALNRKNRVIKGNGY